LKEIQRLKQDLNVNYTNEFRTIDQITFKTKFHDLKQLIENIKQKEINIGHLVQVNINS